MLYPLMYYGIYQPLRLLWLYGFRWLSYNPWCNGSEIGSDESVRFACKKDPTFHLTVEFEILFLWDV